MSKLGSIEDLYRRYAGAVHRRARAILGEDEAARDVLQEVFVRVMRSEQAFRGESSPMTWLYRMTTNYCLNYLRDHRRREDLIAERWTERDPTRPTSDARLTVAALLRDVPEELREIAVYYFVDQMTQEEIASLLGVSRRTVGYRLEEFQGRVGLARKAGER